ncbi:CpsD/CapB family tyrosine-protein kinase [Lactiplantibacillus plantarum]|uniref:CpsD/CapB family tyrosine-protein kinase n=1 Tax=Lactiplantibacillus plantarum TaxID=1590 RepID=UPI003F53ABCD
MAEQFRTIRTNVQFSSADRQLKTLLFTFADPSEGKSTISSNVAVTWADQGNKVLLIDSDLRRPAVARSFRISNSQGLTTILTAKQANLSESIHETEVLNLYVLPSGPVPPNPSELLNSSKMDQLLKVLKEQFDIIILDVPPVNKVTDAQILASKVDGVILVVPQGIALKGAVLRARDLLKKVNANLIESVKYLV